MKLEDKQKVKFEPMLLTRKYINRFIAITVLFGILVFILGCDTSLLEVSQNLKEYAIQYESGEINDYSMEQRIIQAQTYHENTIKDIVVKSLPLTILVYAGTIPFLRRKYKPSLKSEVIINATVLSYIVIFGYAFITLYLYIYRLIENSLLN